MLHFLCIFVCNCFYVLLLILNGSDSGQLMKCTLFAWHCSAARNQASKYYNRLYELNYGCVSVFQGQTSSKHVAHGNLCVFR